MEAEYLPPALGVIAGRSPRVGHRHIDPVCQTGCLGV
jgi:hypothetical protein